MTKQSIINLPRYSRNVVFLDLSAQVPLSADTTLAIFEKSHHDLCWVDCTNNSLTTIPTCLYIVESVVA